MAKSSQGSFYVVANYSPAGNFVGHFMENCPPLKPQFYSNSIPGPNKLAGPPKPLPHHPQAGKPDEIDLKAFARDALKVHNEYRRKHGVPDLVLNDQVSLFIILYKVYDQVVWEKLFELQYPKNEGTSIPLFNSISYACLNSE